MVRSDHSLPSAMPTNTSSQETEQSVATLGAPLETIPDECPFCGVSVADPSLIGLNATVCRSCHENMRLHTPHGCYIYGERCNIGIWSYIPTTDKWDDFDDRAVFLEAGNRNQIGMMNAVTGDRLNELLTDQEISIIHLIALLAQLTDALDEMESFTGISVDALSNPDGSQDPFEVINPFNRTHTDTDETTVRRIMKQLPRPTVFLSERVFTPDPETLQSLFHTTGDGTSQTTLDFPNH